MEDFYPFRSEDIPELNLLVRGSLADKDRWGKESKENAISFLVPLILDLLDDVERSRALKNTFLVDYDYSGNRLAKISDGFWKIVEAYLEENNGTGNLLRITEVLGTNGHWWIKRKYKYTTVMKDIAGDSVSLWNANSVEHALQNSVVLEEVIKKLQPVDQKLFRLVSPTWMEETFSFWRRNARIRIHVAPEKCIGVSYCGIPMLSFMDLWKKNKIPEEEGTENKRLRAIKNTDNCKLQDHPFHSCNVMYSSDMDLFSSGNTEDTFWKLYGPHIKDLKIVNASFNARICEKLLYICPNLQRLDISGQEKISADSWEERNRILNYLNKKAKMNQTKPESRKIVENLHTLILGDTDEESLRSLLFICPNLKTLDLTANQEKLGALLSPTLNGEFIKLKKLVVRETTYIADFISLRQYTEMLAKNKFDSLEHFELTSLLSNARASPFNLYAALAQASKNLKTLKLDLSLYNSSNSVENLDSFMDLSPFGFPNLTKLNLRFNVNFDMKLDLGTLKGMPMLEKLEISVYNYNHDATKMLRNAGAKDWVFEGDRNRYLPDGVILDYQYSDEDPILCSKLKEFTFIGWSLNEEDVKLLSSWFPNLAQLEAEVCQEKLSILEENWQRLEKLVIRTKNLISLGKLRPLKEMKKHLRIFQRISSCMGVKDGLLELKEHNGWLFFPINK